MRPGRALTASGWSISFGKNNDRKMHFYIVFLPPGAHYFIMKTALKLTSAVMAVAFCATAFADTKPVRLAKQQNVQRKMCYALISNSAIPQPCDRLSTIPTTAEPLVVIGAHSTNR